MSNRKKWLGVLAIVLIFVMTVIGCDDDSEEENNSDDKGVFILTNIPSSFNGMYVFFEAGLDDDEDFVLIGAENFKLTEDDFFWSDYTECTGVRISNGSASIPMWIIGNDYEVERYYGNHTVWIELFVGPFIEKPWFEEEAEVEFESVKFSNGSAKRSFYDGKIYY